MLGANEVLSFTLWQRRHTVTSPRRHTRRRMSVPTNVPLSERSDMVVFLNGEIIPADQARVGVMTHAISYGTGCFEGIRGYYNPIADEVYVFRAREHYERLHRSCRILSMTLPYSVDELIE